VPPRSREYLPTEDPFTGNAWALIARGSADDAAAAVEAADQAFNGPWSRLSATERGHLLWKLGDLVQANAARLADIERRDNGKLAVEVLSQVKYMGDYFKYYAGLADKVQSQVIPTDKKGVFTYTRYEPKGVVVIITPWNSPLTLTSWKLAPALAPPSSSLRSSPPPRCSNSRNSSCRRASPRVWSTSSPASDRRWAKRSSRIPRPRTSALPAATRPAARSTRSRRGT
jgi:hypothetical protein